MSVKTVLVTGAAGSLGGALARHCAAAGFHTVMLDSDRRALETAFDAMVDDGLAEPTLMPLDLATAGPEQFDEMSEAIGAQFGGLDALVHCAARFDGLTPLEHVAPPDWLANIQVNLNAAWLLSVHCLPLLRAAPSGRLIFLLEDLDKVGGAYWGPYGVSKHALKALAGQFAAELRKSSVRVLAVNPGPMRSPLRSRAYHSEPPDAQPAPDEAARRIVDLLQGEPEPESVVMDWPRD
ncbi:MAG: SDR family NAD(P)-dependent oxidoreductase [Xanthomonadales bacterium]|nr:SDR family NAD(P)-dependent oxidoreductase [Xanthomonadales bacterium]